MSKDNPSYYAIIPATVRYDKAIPAGAKLLYGEVTALSNQFGYCFASNGYFARLYGCTPQAVSKWFKQLEQARYVAISYHDNNGPRQRRVSITVEGYQPQLMGVSTRVEGVSTRVEHNNTRLLIQDKRERAHAEKETGPTVSQEYFAPDKHETTAAHIIEFLSDPANGRYLNDMAAGDWRRAVKGHCLKLQKTEKWFDLQVPADEDEHYRWMSKRIAGIKSWYETAAEIDRQSGRTSATPATIPAPPPNIAADSKQLQRASADFARKIAGR